MTEKTIINTRLVRVSSQQQIQEALTSLHPQEKVRCIAVANSPDAEYLNKIAKNQRCQNEFNKTAQFGAMKRDAASSVVLLDMNGYNQVVALNYGTQTVTAQSGIKLKDLHEFLDKNGFALTGAINGSSLLSLGGMVITGSQVGSPRHSLFNDVAEMVFVLADGSLKTLTKANEEFNGYFCSLGMMGVLSKVTLKVVPSYSVKGAKRSLSFSELVVDIETNKLSDHDYLAYEWYPATNQCFHVYSDIHEKPNRLTWLEQAVETYFPKQSVDHTKIDAFVVPIITWTIAYLPFTQALLVFMFAFAMQLQFYSNFIFYSLLYIIVIFLGNFFQCSDKFFAKMKYLIGSPNLTTFHGKWYELIPNDRELDLNQVKIHFTEIIIPAEHVPRFIKTLHERFSDKKIPIPTTPVAIDPIPVCSALIAKNSDRNNRVGRNGSGILAYITIMLDDPIVQINNGNSQLLFQPYWDLANELFGDNWTVHWGKLVDNRRISEEKLEKMFSVENWRKWKKFRESADPFGKFQFGVKNGPNCFVFNGSCTYDNTSNVVYC